MNICADCFNIEEIKAFISTSSKTGECNITGTDTTIISIDDIADFLIELISAFKPARDGKALGLLIQEEWELFSSFDTAKIILDEVCRMASLSINSSSLVKYSKEMFSAVNDWITLKEKIKWEQRYFTGKLITDEMRWDLYLSPNDAIEENSVYYRGRLNTSEDCCIEEPEQMGAPPSQLATAGRANPHGIPFLYLTEKDETTMYETRAVYGDKLSIGEFRVVKELNIVNFNKMPNLYIEYSTDGDVTDAIKGYLFRKEISKDLSKPMRRYDTKEIEYVPTQFICEYVKNISNVNGIQFSSSVHEGGENIVLFDINAAKCDKVYIKEIGKVHMEYNN